MRKIFGNQMSKEGIGRRLFVYLLLLSAFCVQGLYAPSSVSADPLLHNSTNLSSTAWSTGWGISGGKYGLFSCSTCHIPETTNIKGIRTSITVLGNFSSTGTNTVNVKFGNQTSMGHDNRSPNTSSANICEVCHTRNKYHNYNATRNTTFGGSVTHNNGADCTGCHPHDAAFKAAGGNDCTGCHNAQQNTYRRQVLSTAAVKADFSVTGALTNMTSHVKTGNFNKLTCEICHDQGSHQTFTNGTNVLLKNTRAASGSITYNGTTASLTNFCIGCHDSSGNANTVPSGSIATATTPYADSGDNNAPKNIFSEWSSAQWTGTSSGLPSNTKMTHRKSVNCADCHGNAGGSGTTLNPLINIHASTSGKFLRYAGGEQNTCFSGTACHGSGSTIAYGATVWSEFKVNNASAGTGGAHPILQTVTPKSTRISADTAGANFVRGWKSNSIATCSDCHGGSAAGPRGPHGSSYPYMLKALDTSNPGTHTNGSALVSYPASPNPKTFCLNCHAADVYGDGNGGAGANGGTRFGHGSTDGWSGTANCGGTSKNPMGTSCQNCHCGKGSSNGTAKGTHSTNGGLGGATTQSGVGFTNGNCWTAPPDSNGCYATTATSSWSGCTKGNHQSSDFRFKKNFKDILSPLQKIFALQTLFKRGSTEADGLSGLIDSVKAQQRAIENQKRELEELKGLMH